MTLTEGSICSSYFNSIITLVGTSDELFCDKVSLTILHYDSLTSIYIFSDEGLCSISLVLEIFDKFLLVLMTVLRML